MSLTGWEGMPPGPAKLEALLDEIPALKREARGASYRMAAVLVAPFCGVLFWHASTVHNWHGVAGMIVSALGVPAYLGACWWAGRAE